MICQACGVEAPTKYVAFYQNIGALVMRITTSMEGNLCKSCIHEKFWRMTSITLLIGWLGMISLLLAPLIVLNNIFRYLFCLTMEPVPLDVTVPRLTSEDVKRIEPHTAGLLKRLRDAEPLIEVASDIAHKARVTPGQVLLCLRQIAASQQIEDLFSVRKPLDQCE